MQSFSLPAFQMERDIVETIASNQITVIAGDTGCGKVSMNLMFKVTCCKHIKNTNLSTLELADNPSTSARVGRANFERKRGGHKYHCNATKKN
jgi:uncharacterized protein YvpB